MSTPQPPRPFAVGDRVRSKADPGQVGVVQEFRGRDNEDSRIAFEGKDPEGFWRRSSEYEIESVEA